MWWWLSFIAVKRAKICDIWIFDLLHNVLPRVILCFSASFQPSNIESNSARFCCSNMLILTRYYWGELCKSREETGWKKFKNWDNKWFIAFGNWRLISIVAPNSSRAAPASMRSQKLFVIFFVCTFSSFLRLVLTRQSLFGSWACASKNMRKRDYSVEHKKRWRQKKGENIFCKAFPCLDRIAEIFSSFSHINTIQCLCTLMWGTKREIPANSTLFAYSLHTKKCEIFLLLQLFLCVVLLWKLIQFHFSFLSIHLLAFGKEGGQGGRRKNC